MSAAHALSLGELELQSGLGQPFAATVHYVTSHPDDLHALCIRSSTGSSGPSGTALPQISGVPFLPDARFDVEPGTNGGTISIRTARAVNEPLMRLNLVIDCGPSAILNREFIIMLDPPRAPVQAPAAAIAPAPAASGVQPSVAAAPDSGAPAEGRKAERRSRRPAPSPAGSASAALPYEPGVTPPPRRGAAARPRGQAAAAARGPQYRLSLSRPEDDLPVNPALRSSDTLTFPVDGTTAAKRDALREEWHLRQADDPLGQAQRMNEQLTKLDRGLAEVIKQVSSLKDERDRAQARVRLLEEEKQSLAAWLNGLSLALAFVGCVALAALGFWTYRRRVEQRQAQRSLFDSAPAMPAQAVRSESEAVSEEQFDVPPWRGEAPAPVPPAAPERPAMQPTPPRPAAPRPAPVPQPQAEPATQSYTSTVQLDRRQGPAANSNLEIRSPAPVTFPAQAPVPLGVVPVAVPPSAEHDETQSLDLPDIAFDLPPPQEAAGPAVEGEGGFSIEFGAPPHAPAQSSAAAAAAEAADPFAHDAAPPPPPAIAVTYVPSAPARVPTPTQGGMKILVDELAAAQLGGAGAAPPAVTASHRTLDIELGEDDDSEMRAQLYRQEFELKLFPEIVHGQAKLKVPHSVISLARTYYQEDFDTNRAVNLLEYAADRTPDPQRVRLALLEILRMEAMAREYISVARAFHKQFPGAEEWPTVAAYGKLLAPEEALFAAADTTGYDLNMPSMWLGSTLDMTRYVLAQDLHDAMHGPVAATEQA